jgi:predicted metal-dependent hydrolase
MEDLILGRFREGVDLFNKHSFYNCHDVLEDVWFDVRGHSRRFYQGLIHLAVGFHHITVRENSKGALSQLNKGIEKLSEYAPQFQGIELKNLLNEIRKCVEVIRKVKAEDFDTTLIPKIEFNAELFTEP